MGEQQSQKRGLRSEAQKEDRARKGYAPIPASSPVVGAFGKQKRVRSSGNEALKSVPEKKTEKKV